METHEQLPQPGMAELRAALGRVRPELAGASITVAGDGWDFWTFDAGGYIMRVPKLATGDDGRPLRERLHVDRRLLAAIEPAATLPIPKLEVHDDALWDGRPFTLHQRLPGVPLIDLRRPLATGSGVALGRFFRRLQEFPVQRALDLGLPYEDGPSVRRSMIRTYETYVRRAFPLLGCESRTHAARTFEAHINDPWFWDFRPALTHADVNDHNVLADPQTGEITGIIDFTDARVSDPANDATWAFADGFARHGIAGELPAFLQELGLTAEQMERHRPFLEVWWPLDDIDHGVEVGDRDLIEDGIYRLHAVTPRGIVCDA